MQHSDDAPEYVLVAHVYISSSCRTLCFRSGTRAMCICIQMLWYAKRCFDLDPCSVVPAWRNSL